MIFPRAGQAPSILILKQHRQIQIFGDESIKKLGRRREYQLPILIIGNKNKIVKIRQFVGQKTTKSDIRNKTYNQ